MTTQEQAGMAWSEVAARAYRAYGAITSWKNYQGLPMPEFDALPENIKTAWEAAVRQAYSDLSYGSVKGPEGWEGWERPCRNIACAPLPA